MRTLGASVLLSEVFVIGFAGLVAMQTSDTSAGTVWAVCGAAMAACLLVCGVITRPGGVALGWIVQLALIVSGVAVSMMYILGVMFAALWWAAVHYGRKVDEAKAARAAAS